MPLSLRDWLPEDHLAWFVIETVGRLDLQAFYAAYRADGHGRAAYKPSMMLSLDAACDGVAGPARRRRRDQRDRRYQSLA